MRILCARTGLKGHRLGKARETSGTKIDALMELASSALVKTRYFEAERTCLEALTLARKAKDYERMARICMPLQESRRQKRLAALDAGVVARVDHESLTPKVKAGCYLFEPLLVAADARDLRDLADSEQVPVLVIAREPKTRLGQWPVAMIGPVTVRTRIAPPAKDKPDEAWMQAASEALGDEAIDSLELDRPAEHLVDQLLDRLATLPDHEKLHQRLEEACREAAIVEAEAGSKGEDSADEADDDL